MTKTAAKKAVKNTVDTAAYGEFIKGLQIGDVVSVYNMETGNTYSTAVTGLTTKHITTKRTGSMDAPIRFTRRGTGTDATGTAGLKLKPYARPRLVKFNPKRVHRPSAAKYTTVEAVEAAV